MIRAEVRTYTAVTGISATTATTQSEIGLTFVHHFEDGRNHANPVGKHKCSEI